MLYFHERRERGTLPIRGIGFNVPNLTGPDCVFVHPAQLNGPKLSA